MRAGARIVRSQSVRFVRLVSIWRLEWEHWSRVHPEAHGRHCFRRVQSLESAGTCPRLGDGMQCARSEQDEVPVDDDQDECVADMRAAVTISGQQGRAHSRHDRYDTGSPVFTAFSPGCPCRDRSTFSSFRIRAASGSHALAFTKEMRRHAARQCAVLGMHFGSGLRRYGACPTPLDLAMPGVISVDANNRAARAPPADACPYTHVGLNVSIEATPRTD